MRSPLSDRSPIDWLSLMFLVVCWGSTFALTKVALETLPPLWIVAGRLVVGAGALLAVLFLRGECLPMRLDIWLWLTVIGVLGVLPIFLISWGTQHISTALSGILFGVSPLVTIVIAHFWVPGEHLTAPKAMGFAVGFCGLVVLLGPCALTNISGGGVTLLAQLAMVGAASGYAVRSICAKMMPNISPFQKGAGSFLCAVIIAIPLVVMFGADLPVHVSARSLAATAAMGLFATAISGIVMFRLVHSAGPSFLSLTNYLIPLYVLLLGTTLLGEKISSQALVALGLIVSGIAVSEWRRHRDKPTEKPLP